MRMALQRISTEEEELPKPGLYTGVATVHVPPP